MRNLTTAALAALILSTSPVLAADPFVVGAPAPQSAQITSERQFMTAHSSDIIFETTEIKALLTSPVGTKRPWRSMMSNISGTLTLLGRDTDGKACGRFHHEVHGVGQWDFHACQLVNGQFSID